MKTCSKCKIEKCESQFRARKDRPCGLRSQCKQCDLAYDKSEAGRQSIKRYRRSDKYKIKNLLRSKAYFKTDQGKATRKRYAQSAKGRLMSRINKRLEKNRLAAKRYMQSERGRLIYRQRDRRRRERKRGLDLQFTKQDALLVYFRFNRRCFNCGNTERLEIDHHMPLSKGFGLSIKNAVLLCKSCNTSKADKMPEEFYTQDKLVELTKLFQV